MGLDGYCSAAAAEPQNNHTHSAIAVAKPGVTIAQVDADLNVVCVTFFAGKINRPLALNPWGDSVPQMRSERI